MSFKRLCLVALSLALLLVYGPVGAWGQGQTTGSIRGRVTGPEGNPVATAQVVARNVATGLTRGAVTDQNGRYAILLLPPGSYSVQAQSVGFTAGTAQEVRVTLNETTALDFTLSSQAVALEGITVTGGGARVDPGQAGVVQTITPEQVENLPTAGRDFTDLINLSPLVSPQPGVGTGGQFAIAGARTSGTNVQIDGTDANNVFFGENRGSSRTPFAFSLESIQEFQLITNGFDVEYGNYQGGVVNAVTKGGTNELRGTAFGFFRDAAFTGDDFEGQAPRDYEVQQFGFSLSGPVVRDRLHFFASVDAQNKNQPIFALTPEASEIPQNVITEFSQAMTQLGFPDAASTVGQKVQGEDNLVLFGRLDWTINQDHRLTLRQNYSDFEQTNDRITSNEPITRGGPFVNKSWSTVLELNSVFGANAFNTFRFQFSDEDRPRNPNTPGGYLPQLQIDDVSGTLDIFAGGDGVIFRNRLEEGKLQFIDNFTYQAGSHTLKIGTNNLYSNTVNEFYNGGNGSYRFSPTRTGTTVTATALQNFLAGRPTEYRRNVRQCSTFTRNAAGQNVLCQDLDVPIAEFTYLEWSAYAQDEWQVTDRLLVTPGIRFGGTTFQDEPEQVTTVEAAFADPLTGDRVQSSNVPDFTGISPRLAFTFDMGGDETRLLRGGVGLLIGRAPTVLAGNVFQTEKPLLQVVCSGADIPAFNLQELLAAPRGENNPAQCASGAAASGRPEHAMFSEEFELPQTLKANLGYETILFGATQLSFDVIYSRTENNFTVRDLNLRPQGFTLGTENRPVFVPQASYAPTSSAGVPRLLNPAFERVYLNTAEGEARSWAFTAQVEQRIREDLQFGVSYGYVNAYDNGSFSCCTSFEGFNEVTAGDPNFVGDPGDEDNGYWGPSEFERRHTVVLNFLWNAPFGINASGIVRSTSGTPWTPIVDDDVNGDGVFGNDRVYVGNDLRFATPQDQATFDRLVQENECLSDQMGRIVRRNSCRNPWFHSLDVRLAKEINTFAGQNAEIVLDVFNVLNGLNSDWGRLVGVIGNDQELLDVASYDRATNQNVYRVNETFADADPLGFDPFQFQAQLGIRYRFGGR